MLSSNRNIWALAGALMLAACASHAEPGRALAPLPGHWETTVFASDQGRRAAIRRSLVSSIPSAFDPAAVEISDARNCDYARRSIGGGRIDIDARCLEADGSWVRVAGRGVYGAHDVRLTLNRWDAEDAKAPAFTARIHSRRLSAPCGRELGDGPCP